MVPRSLQEDLLRIPGVEGAEVEGTGEQPAGLRIRIAAGADQRAVGAAIRRVLTEHGLGTDTRLPGEESAAADVSAAETVPTEPDTPAEVETEAEVASAVAVLEDTDAEVIDLTDETDLLEHEEADTVETPDESDVAALEPIDLPAEPPDTPEAVAPEAAPPDTTPPEPALPPAPVASETGYARIESVSVEEGRDGILVTITSSDGETVAQLASSSEGGLDAAIVKATSRLALPEAPDPVIVDLDERRVEGVDIVTLVLDTDGHITAGSSIVVAGRAFAVGRAAWSALTN